MIIEVSGDILLSHAQAIAHGVAPNDHFDQGLALSLREQYPAMVKDFRHYMHLSHAKTGEIWAWAGADSKRIFNLLTQDGKQEHGAKPQRATLSHVSHALKHLKAELEKENITSLAMPKLATGVGGLNWEEVFPVIKEYFAQSPIKVYVYTHYAKGIKADEKADEQ